MKIKKGDKVKVLAGKDKGKTGTVLETYKDTEKVLVEGINLATKHRKNTRVRSQGQIIELGVPIHVSNVALVEGDKAVRVGYAFEGEGEKRKKVRVARPSGKQL